jgi:uncharacterized protein (DUF952 family)
VILYHLTTRTEWQAAQEAGLYTSPTLDSAGFIHASTAQQVINVANAFYPGQNDLILLVIDTESLRSELRWEPPDHIAETDELPPEQGLFPHIYGPVNLTAVAGVLELAVNSAGLFIFPSQAK